MQIKIPKLSLIALIGVSGSGKSVFAKQHFLPTEVISSDYCRGLVSDDENNQEATNDAFDMLHYIAAKRLKRGRLTVIDATNVQLDSRKPLIRLAREYHCIPVAIVLNLPEDVCHERNAARPDRNFGAHVVRNQARQLKRSIKRLKKEGFRHIHILNTVEEVEAAAIIRELMWCDKGGEHGPFDIIGDIHGCFEELCELLQQLGYRVETSSEPELSGWRVEHPEGRKVVFLGDLVDRGPRIVDVLRLVMSMLKQGNALSVPGNHDMKLLKYLSGKQVKVTYGLDQSIAQLEPESEAFRAEVKTFLYSMISHYVLDDGKLVVAHGGLREEMQGRGSGAVRSFCLYGKTTGETDEFGLPVRYNWAAEYRGRATVVYGHTPVPEPEWLNHTINIDTGCVFGGQLTALRYPEKELVSVPARQTYFEPAKPIVSQTEPDTRSAQQKYDDLLYLEDVTGKRIISTKYRRTITIREENAIAALEIMSRFAVNPKWLIYLPPTMSPSETSSLPGLLEHPFEAFDYYRKQGVETVVCEEKHMGSRAIVIICRDAAVVNRRFGIPGDAIGICYTRTGRRFFTDVDLETQFLERIRTALTATGFWDQLKTDWVCFDCELMPWSAKAQALLKEQYAAVGAAATAACPDVLRVLKQTKTRGLEVNDLLEQYSERQNAAIRFVDAYRQYCWPVRSVTDLKLAPFHILATEGQAHPGKDHLWHIETITQVCQGDHGLLLTTAYRQIHVHDETSVQEGIAWWEELTGRGGEGMVVKPLDFIARGKKGLAQPALKCRGKEYLRIIYGPEYTRSQNMERLKNRGLSRKRSLALREFALGLEALERFVNHEPLRRVHECVFGVLALESEPVDPRL